LILTCEGIGGEQVRLGRADGLGLVGFTSVLRKKKVGITSLNFHESSFFLSELQNQAKHLLPFLKLFILPHWPGYKQFRRRFYFFSFFIYFG